MLYDIEVLVVPHMVCPIDKKSLQNKNNVFSTQMEKTLGYPYGYNILYTGDRYVESHGNNRDMLFMIVLSINNQHTAHCNSIWFSQQ